MRNKKKRKWLWILIVAIVTFAAFIAIIRDALRKAANQAVYKNYEVKMGSIVESVTANGVLRPKDTVELKLPSGYRIEEVFVSPGERVEAGQKLASLDVKTLNEISIALSDEIARLDNELAFLSRNNKSEALYSPVKGRIKKIFCGEGDDVHSVIAERGALLVISSDERMSFEIETENDIPLKAKVNVILRDGKEKTGLIESKTSRGYLITLTDDGPKVGDKAQAFCDGAFIGEGTLSVNAPVTVLANGGTVGKLHVGENDRVDRGEKLITLDDEPFINSYQSAFNARYEAAQKAAGVLKSISDPVIVAPEEGTVSDILVKDGQTIADASGDEQTVFMLDVGGAVKMEAKIDELDIDLIRTGQHAIVTVDALDEEEFNAVIEHISGIGNNVNGITTYDVTLELERDDRLFSGMNAASTIVIRQKDNVLLIPLEIIEEDENGEYVYIIEDKEGGGSERTRVDITTGISDGIYAEVTSGLSEGDMVNYEYISAMEAAMMRFMGDVPNGRRRRGF